ncbi:MAG: hypothetical protein J7501_06970 [Bdellovibrio sp.]|nr:hypothetical protein [Bdellovibrio sp.]
MDGKFLPGLAILATGLLMACSQASFDLPTTSNDFSQSIAYNNKVDILWVMDNSSSMKQHQDDLSKQIPDMVAKLNSLKMDYHMAVVTSSMGGTNPTGGHLMGAPRYLTSGTANMATLMKDRLVVGQDGSDLERGLMSMEAVLSSSYQANEGKGFLRDDALLVVIALSDEDDKSKSSGAVNYYTNVLDSVKTPWVDGSRSWVFNFIGVLSVTSQCKTFNDYAEAGTTFIGLADTSGGTKDSICSSDLSSAVGNIRARIVQIITDYKLTDTPNVDTIVVTINGQVIPRSSVNGWDYIPSINAVRFFGTAVPASDSSIRVTYKPAGAS